MPRFIVPVVVFGMCTASVSFSAARSGSPSALQGSTAEDGVGKVMCMYLSYGTKKYVCGEPPVSEVKKRCDQKASEERGEPTECDCTEDPSYIQGACD